MNQDSSFPPMLPPSTELGALLFAVLPCLQETYRPLASFAYHMTELTRLKNIPSVPPLTGLSGIDALITDKDIMLRSLSFYGRMFRMPLLSTIATLLQGLQFYQAYKDILPGLFSGPGGTGTDPSSGFGNMAGLFSGLGGLGGFGNNNNSEISSPDLFSMLGGLSPDLVSSLFTGFSGGSAPHNKAPGPSSTEFSDTPVQPSDDHITANTSTVQTPPSDDITVESTGFESASAPNNVPQDTDTTVSTPADDLYNTLSTFLTPEQQKIYEQLMHTD